MLTKKLGTRGLLIAAAVVSVVLWQIPWGFWVLYPFTLLATYAHEMGHGLTALVLGGHFNAFVMHPDGSGLAQWNGDVGRLGRAMVAAGGLIGPSIAGATILSISRSSRRAPLLLYVFGAAMVATALLFARNIFSIIFILSWAATLIGVAKFSPKRAAPFLIQLVGVQLCIAVFRDVSYMFSPGAKVGGVLRPSDSAQIADALLLPYWFWGGLVAVVSFVVLAAGLYVALKPRD